MFRGHQNVLNWPQFNTQQIGQRGMTVHTITVVRPMLWRTTQFTYKYELKRMHSSRMRTVRCSGRVGGGCLPRGVSTQGELSGYGGICLGVSAWGCLPRGCLPKGGCLRRGGISLGGVCLEGFAWGVCQGGGCPARHPLWTESQTGVKTLPLRNYCCGR